MPSCFRHDTYSQHLSSLKHSHLLCNGYPFKPMMKMFRDDEVWRLLSTYNLTTKLYWHKSWLHIHNFKMHCLAIPQLENEQTKTQLWVIQLECQLFGLLVIQWFPYFAHIMRTLWSLLCVNTPPYDEGGAPVFLITISTLWYKLFQFLPK